MDLTTFIKWDNETGNVHILEPLILDQIDFAEICKRYLEQFGYNVVKREPELKACPVCGGRPTIFSSSQGICIECETCEIEQSNFYELQDEAIEAWNALPRKEQQ